MKGKIKLVVAHQFAATSQKLAFASILCVKQDEEKWKSQIPRELVLPVNY